jgi:hypothetical protein
MMAAGVAQMLLLLQFVAALLVMALLQLLLLRGLLVLQLVLCWKWLLL